MAVKIAGAIMRLNKQIDALSKKAGSIKDKSAKEEAAYHVGLMMGKVKSLSSALSATALFNRLSSHHHAATKKAKRK